MIFSAIITAGLASGVEVERLALRAVAGIVGGFALGAIAGWVGGHIARDQKAAQQQSADQADQAGGVENTKDESLKAAVQAP